MAVVSGDINKLGKKIISLLFHFVCSLCLTILVHQDVSILIDFNDTERQLEDFFMGTFWIFLSSVAFNKDYNIIWFCKAS
jgi:hypothetical protein